MPTSTTSNLLLVLFSTLTSTSALPTTSTNNIPAKAEEFSRILYYTDSQCTTFQGSDSSQAQAMNNVCLAPSEAGKYASVSVTGRGCATYYFSDGGCEKNVFGEGKAVPDSACYAGVGSVRMDCH